MTENAKAIKEWQATRPAFNGTLDTRIGGKAARRTAKARLVKKASKV